MKKIMNRAKLKYIAAGAAVVIGMTGTALAQSIADPWTGSIPGDTIQFPGDDSLKDIRKLLNAGEIDTAVNLARRHAAGFERDTRSGKTSAYRYDAYNALCIALTAQKSYEEARVACETAIEDNSDRWMAYNSRGNLQMRMGNYNEAINDYNIALSHAPSSSNLRSVLQHNVELAQSKRSN